MLTKKQKEQAAQDIAKSLLPLLPKVKFLSQEEEYIQKLDTEERQRYLLRAYFDKQKKRRKPLTPQTEFCWIVLCEPFPQLFEYRNEDEEFFSQFSPIKFKFFKFAYHFYLRLIKQRLFIAKNNRRASFYSYPVKIEESE
jgi:hypothetical protein